VVREIALAVPGCLAPHIDALVPGMLQCYLFLFCFVFVLFCFCFCLFFVLCSLFFVLCSLFFVVCLFVLCSLFFLFLFLFFFSGLLIVLGDKPTKNLQLKLEVKKQMRHFCVPNF
jgi:hypothetical protein